MKKIICLALALSIGTTLHALASAFWGGTIINIAPTDTLKIRKWPSASSQIVDAFAVGANISMKGAAKTSSPMPRSAWMRVGLPIGNIPR